MVFRAISFLILFSILAGCSYKHFEAKAEPLLFFKEEVGLTWPAPPDKPRLKLIKIIDSPATFKKSVRIDTKTSAFIKWLIGEEEEPYNSFERPYFVLYKNDRIYIVDQGFFTVIVLDLKEAETLYLQKTAEGDILFYPTSVAVDEDGKIYVCDPEKNRIVIYDKNGYPVGNFVGNFGNWRPCSIAYSENKKRFYVVDSVNHNVKIFNKNFELLKVVGERGEEKGQFSFPSHITLDKDGNFYVTDSMNFRVQVFSPDGRYKYKVGEIGKGEGYFERPKGVAVDSYGHLYIVDSLKDAIQVFDNNEKFLMIVGEEGRYPGQFNLPSGIYCDEQNYIYVADTLNKRVQILKYIGDGS